MTARSPDAALTTLAAAAEGWGAPLDAAALERVESYLRAVAQKNKTTNLTADDAWDDLVLRHAADGVFAAATLRRALGRGAARVCDLGSGGGFIGVCLKIAWPEAQVTLMEAVERKFKFLNAESVRLGLPGLRVLQRRAGDGRPYNAYESGFDAVVERALAPLEEALALARPLLKRHGLFAAFQSVAAEPPLAGTRMRLLESVAYRRPREAADRFLVLYRAED
ncbi:MAG: RsmG family class I SAM-dependent methyltransferase [Elusimicrobiota bacterium]|nr:RsmG family class I SAM-dependent methyltransferase [Elusimicrobiota bacterium]